MHCPYTGRKIISPLDFSAEWTINLSGLPDRQTTKGDTTMNEREIKIECLKIALAANNTPIPAGKLVEEASLLEGYISGSTHSQPYDTERKE